MGGVRDWHGKNLPHPPIKKGGGRSPQPFLMGFREAGGHFDTPNSTNEGFKLSAPFGAAPFHGHPTVRGAGDQEEETSTSKPFFLLLGTKKDTDHDHMLRRDLPCKIWSGRGLVRAILAAAPRKWQGQSRAQATLCRRCNTS